MTREDVKAYADAGRDQNPLHQDDDFARGVGFDGIIAHGMFTMGHMAACVADWAGDPEAIVKIVGAVPRPGGHGGGDRGGRHASASWTRSAHRHVETWVTRGSAPTAPRSMPVKRGEAVVRLR